jgi:hypothetical protein
MVGYVNPFQAVMDIDESLEVPVRFSIRDAWAMALLILVIAGGCRGGGRSNQAQETSTLKPLAVFYGSYISQHGGKRPASEEEFKAFIKDPKNAGQLKLFQITNVDDLFISPRDREPYVVIYGKTSSAGGPPVVAYEKTGVEGKRFVVNALGGVEEVDEAKFRSMVPSAP